MIEFWTATLALTLVLYVILDGFDLGVGILFGTTRNEDIKRQMLNSISPIWDGNETWLVLTASILFGAFPVVYSLVLSAFYLPIILLLAALIFRGIAFEFREKSRNKRWLWDAGFSIGSLVASFVQGAAVGAIIEGIPNAAGRFTGTAFGWLTPFSVLCGVGLCLGYSLLGAGWLVKKSEGSLRDTGYRLIPRILIGVLSFLAIAFVMSLVMELEVMRRWLDRPGLAVFPLLGIVGCALIVQGLRSRRDGWPFSGAVLLFLSAFGTLAMSFLPYMVPFTITIEQAAAPHSSLSFMFWGAGLFVMPLTLIYTAIVYWLFKGKSHAGSYH
ncbi:cytochrome d ubiquinol oxidase subunit II [Rhizobium leguminosarum]|uniref:cytochrome d ubiquinol oxidase subunit II n=1 Tax=Rhizobium leguminosarum TaxID=384 RepID=UPI001C93D9BB|nr:cytochrome d ubiquinol oxidase subunit II [Rhizobium leguminosarum]MBY5705754.1 cytochrome d ubiquinol oxidase subunit II [Rhizobium leguminosarum]